VMGEPVKTEESVAQQAQA